MRRDVDVALMINAVVERGGMEVARYVAHVHVYVASSCRLYSSRRLYASHGVSLFLRHAGSNHLLCYPAGHSVQHTVVCIAGNGF